MVPLDIAASRVSYSWIDISIHIMLGVKESGSFNAAKLEGRAAVHW